MALTNVPRRTVLWLLLLLAGAAGGLLAYSRRNAPDCHWSESAKSCYRQGLGVAVRAVRTPRGDPGRRTLQARAVALMRESCRRRYGPACHALARQLLIDRPGDGTVHRQAAGLYEQGCHAPQPSGAACNALGEAYAYAVGRPRDPVRALASFERACGLGHATACYRAAGRIRGLAERGPWRWAEAFRLGKLACSRGSMTGCLDLAARTDGVLRDTVPERYGRARYQADRTFVVSTYTRACEKDFFVGCHNVGRLYHDAALGFAPDTAKAQSYYERACRTTRNIRDRGRSLSCKALGDVLAQRGAPRAQVDSLYRTGCEMLAPEACLALARLRAEGPGASAEVLEQSLELAVTACVHVQGNAEGCALAAKLYARPELLDPEAVLRYRRRACDLGAAPECLELGNHWAVRESTGLEYKYYRRACALPRGAEGCQWLREQADLRRAGGACEAPGTDARCPRPAARRSRIVGMGSVPGTLAPGDGVLDDGSYYDEWIVRAESRRALLVTVRAPGFDPFLSIGGLRGSAFQELWSNDDEAEDSTHARVRLLPPRGGDLVIRVNTFGPTQHGDYVLAVDSVP